MDGFKDIQLSLFRKVLQMGQVMDNIVQASLDILQGGAIVSVNHPKRAGVHQGVLLFSAQHLSMFGLALSVLLWLSVMILRKRKDSPNVLLKRPVFASNSHKMIRRTGSMKEKTDAMKAKASANSGDAVKESQKHISNNSPQFTQAACKTERNPVSNRRVLATSKDCLSHSKEIEAMPLAECIPTTRELCMAQEESISQSEIPTMARYKRTGLVKVKPLLGTKCRENEFNFTTSTVKSTNVKDPTSKKMRKGLWPRKTHVAHKALKPLPALSPHNLYDRKKSSLCFKDKAKKVCYPRDDRHAIKNIRLCSTTPSRRKSPAYVKEERPSWVDECSLSSIDNLGKMQIDYWRQDPGDVFIKPSSRSRSRSDGYERKPEKVFKSNISFNRDKKSQYNGKLMPASQGVHESRRRNQNQKNAEVCSKLTKLSRRSVKCRTFPSSSLQPTPKSFLKKRKGTKETKRTAEGNSKIHSSRLRKRKCKIKSSKIRGQYGKCETCSKERMMPIKGPFEENRFFLRTDNLDHHDSIFQRVPFLKSFDKGEEYCTETVDHETSKKVVLNSLLGKGAFRSYREVQRQRGSQPVCCRKEDINTNKSLVSSDHLVFPQNVCHFMKGGDCKMCNNHSNRFLKTNTPIGTDTNESAGDCDKNDNSESEMFWLNSSFLPPLDRVNSVSSSHWACNSPADADNNGKEDKKKIGNDQKHINLNSNVLNRHRLHPRTAYAIEKPHVCSHADKTFRSIKPYRVDGKMATPPHRCASQMAVGKQLSQLNRLLQGINQQSRSDKCADECQTSVNYHICGMHHSSFETVEKESNDSDSKKSDKEQMDSLSDYGYWYDDHSTAARDGTETSSGEYPNYSRFTATNQTRRKGHQRKRARQKESTGLHCRKRMYSPHHVDYDLNICRPSSTTTNVYRNSEIDVKRLEKNKPWRNCERCHHFMIKRPRPDGKEISASVSPERIRHKEWSKPKTRKWTVRHEPYRCFSRGHGIRQVPVIDVTDSAFTCFQNQSSVPDLKPVAKSDLIKENVFDGVDMYCLLQEMQKMEAEDVLTPPCDALQVNKNNCSPSRNNSQLDSVNVEKPTTSAGPQPNEINNSVGFDVDKDNSQATYSHESNKKTYSVEKTTLVTACETGDKNDILQAVSPHTSQTNENMHLENHRILRNSQLPDEKVVMHSPGMESMESLETRLILTSFDTDERSNVCPRNSRSKSTPPCKENISTVFMSSHIRREEADLVDHGIQTSPNKTVSVAVQTSLVGALSGDGKNSYKWSSKYVKCLYPGPINIQPSTPTSISGVEASSSKSSSLEIVTYMDKSTQTQNRNELDVSQNAPPNFKVRPGKDSKGLPPETSESDGSQFPNYLLVQDTEKGTEANDSSQFAFFRSPNSSQRGEAILSSSPSLTCLNTTQEFNSSILKSSNSTLENSGSKFSYFTRPNWSNVKVEEIDKRVKRALQLRQELQKSKSRKSKPPGNLSDNKDENSTSRPDPSNPSDHKEISKPPKHQACACLRQSFQNNSNTNTFMPHNTSLPDIPESFNVERDRERFKITLTPCSREERLKNSFGLTSHSQSPSLCSLPCSSPKFRNSSGSGNTKLQRSHSFNVHKSSTAEQQMQRSVSQVPLFSQQEVKLKRSGSHDKNSPPTKISRMENMSSDCQQLKSELVQSLPQVPLASFVEWFIETSHLGQSVVSANSATSTATDGLLRHGRPCSERERKTSIVEGKGYMDDVEREESSPYNIDKQTYPLSCKENLSRGKPLQTCSNTGREQLQTTRQHRLNSRQSSQPFRSGLVKGDHGNTTSVTTAETFQGNKTCNPKGHSDLENNVRRTIIALRKSSDVSGIVTKVSCHD